MNKRLVTAALLAGCATAGLSPVFAADNTTTLSGKAFVDLTHVSEKGDGVKTDNTGTGLDVTRFYLGVDHTFDDIWSADLTTDFAYSSADNYNEVYVKKAYLQAKFSQAAVLRIGSADLPWIPFEESIYGYRYVEKTQIDRLGLGTSADYGLHLGGTVADGLVSYAGSVVNGAGYKHFQHSKSVDVEGRVSVNPIKELTLAAGLYSGKLGKDKESNPAEHTATRYDALVAFVTKQFRVGGSYFQAKNWNLVQTDPITPLTDKAEGFSVYGSFYFTPVASVFARYDYTKPSKRLDNDLKEDYFNVGAAYSPTKGVDLAVVYKYTKRDNDISETKRNEIGVFGQLAF